MRSAKLLAPESFGLTPIAQYLYVERSADNEMKTQLRDAMAEAERAISIAYGSVESRPIVHACVTEECYQSFGGFGSRAKVYGTRILLSPRGLNWHFLAHEWSHAELHTRLTLNAWWHLPQWFDEGLAVAISEAPEHSETHWQFLIDSNIPHPTREELLTYKSLNEWLDAVHRYGDTQNIERKARGEPEVRPVYTAAGHEVRPWLRKAGSIGLIQFIQRMNETAEFDLVYPSVLDAAEGF